MTGWRLGWAVGRPELIAALARVKNYVDTGAFLAVQAAGAAVLSQAESLARGYVARFKERRDAMLPALRSQGFEPETPQATMYVWVPLPEGVPSAAFQRRALEDAGVVTLPGSAFGAGGRSEEHTSELQSRLHLVCRLLLEKKKKQQTRQKRCSQSCRHALG